MFPLEGSEAPSVLETTVPERHESADDAQTTRTGYFPSNVSVENQRRRSRSRSLLQSFIASNPPLGIWQATGEIGSKVSTLSKAHDGPFGIDGELSEGQQERRRASHDAHQQVMGPGKSSVLMDPADRIIMTKAYMIQTPRHETVQEESVIHGKNSDAGVPPQPASRPNANVNAKAKYDQVIIMENINDESVVGPDETGNYPNGYRFPKRRTCTQSFSLGLKIFWKFFLTPMGFIITIYGINIVGWGAMIFLLLLNATPAMCHPACSNVWSARKIWIEIDSQVLTALFCITGFGMIPWRVRDFYYLIRWRLCGNGRYHRKLAGINGGWYRLPGSDRVPAFVGPPPVYGKKRPRGEDDPPPYSAEEIRELEENDALPFPPTSIPDPPLTGVRAPPTKPWKMDILIWTYVWNTLVQIALAGIMWGLNRFKRPSWATGFLITIGLITGMMAGYLVYEGNSKIRMTEGIPIREYDVIETPEEYQKRMAKEDAKRAKKRAKYSNATHPQPNPTDKDKRSRWFTRH